METADALSKEEMERLINTSLDNDFFYLLFMTAKTTGRRLGEFYGVQDKIVMNKRKVIGTKKAYDVNGKLIIVNKTIPIYKNSKNWSYGVQVKDIDINRKTMKIWVLKRRDYIQDETILTEEVAALMKQYINRHKLKPDDYLFRKYHYRHIQNRVKHYAKKAGIEKNVSAHCVSEDTECLTVDGWKKYNELKIGEKIFSYNFKTSTIEEDSIQDINIYNFNDNLYRIKNKYIDLKITPEHKVLAKYSRGVRKKDIWTKNYQLIKMEDLMNIKSLRQIKFLIGSEKKSGKSIGKNKAKILGWILSDGCIDKNGDITIHQCFNANPEKCNIISKILSDSGIPYSIKIQKEKVTGYNIKNGKKSHLIIFRLLRGKHGKKKGKDTNWVYEYINKDRTPKWKLLELNSDELFEIVNSMILGDGTANKKYPDDVEYQGQNKKRIEFLRIASLFTGKRTSIGKKIQDNKKYSRVYITKKSFCDVINNISKENYKGKVWCPTTKNGTWIAKRNNTLFISGNSFRHYYITQLIKQGWSHNEIAKLTGHKSIGTLVTYDHVIAEDLREKAELAIRKF